MQRQLDYQDINGSWQSLKPMPIVNSYSLFSKYEQLIRHLNKQDQTKEIWAIYIEDSFFAKLCNDCLILAGIKPEHCSAEMLISFLFPHVNDKGELQQQGIIFSFNFPHKQNKAKQKASITELNEILAALWATTEDLEQANRLIKELSIEDLDSLLRYKKQLMKPEKIKKQKAGFDDAMQIMKDKGLMA